MWCKNFFSGWECWGTYSLVHIMIHGLPMGAEAAAGVERDQMADQQKAEIDSSAPFVSVRAAVSMFGDCIQTGHAHHPQPHSSSHQGYVGHQAPHAPSHNAEVHASALWKPRFQIFGVKYVEFALLPIHSLTFNWMTLETILNFISFSVC
jgi:hypothetical protein